MTSDEEMTETGIDPSGNRSSKTERFAQWLMSREERRAEKESNLEGLIKMNLFVSFLTLGVVGGFESVRLAVSLIPYL